MKKILLTALCAASFMSAQQAFAQIAGSTTLGVSVEELKTVATGWSYKKQLSGKDVYNEKNEKVGTIEDMIIAPNGSSSYFIIGAGGFVGLGKHDVAVPFSQVTESGKKLILNGATKDIVKNMPKFNYAK